MTQKSYKLIFKINVLVYFVKYIQHITRVEKEQSELQKYIFKSSFIAYTNL
jgi:hypothetical protein